MELLHKHSLRNQSLATICCDLSMCMCRKPTRQQISKRMIQICQKEGLQVNESTLEALVEGANSDIRLILGQLQMVRLSSRALSYDEVKVCQLLSNRRHMLSSVCGCYEDILYPACLTPLRNVSATHDTS